MTIAHVLPDLLKDEDLWYTLFSAFDSVLWEPLNNRIEEFKNRTNIDYVVPTPTDQPGLLDISNDPNKIAIVKNLANMLGYHYASPNFEPNSFLRFATESARFIPDVGTPRFIDFMSYLLDTVFDIEELWYDPVDQSYHGENDTQIADRRIVYDDPQIISANGYFDVGGFTGWTSNSAGSTSFTALTPVATYKDDTDVYTITPNAASADLYSQACNDFNTSRRYRVYARVYLPDNSLVVSGGIAEANSSGTFIGTRNLLTRVGTYIGPGWYNYVGEYYTGAGGVNAPSSGSVAKIKPYLSITGIGSDTINKGAISYLYLMDITNEGKYLDCFPTSYVRLIINQSTQISTPDIIRLFYSIAPHDMVVKETKIFFTAPVQRINMQGVNSSDAVFDAPLTQLY